ncbi:MULTISPECIES: TetR/AcrR family transcriptional regulator [unclassified Terrabacter]|uniref:TetR/AcrR family transcriptional regulator n=1 Tax=unclassified Terrabacter TaxID=2630222 RepID=UPI0006F5F42B|nr:MULTISPECIES: TetR/AcrR family transcriptional regulator [unclassified Terrabacter]KRB45458.1 TetR family transcriptional regulator [Terrabacter sp. Root181]KRF41311.1 TetR family transcriptional regulator [Terrabacter sp. Soil810]
MTSRSPGTRVRMPRAEREAQMLAVAEQVFSSRGIQAATMDEIAELVGVTKPLIYDYFGSKEGLLAATIERARGQLLTALIDSWVAQPGAPARDRVRGVVHAFFSFIDDHDQAFALLRTEGALIGEASASVERIRQQTAKAFAEGLRTLPAFEALEARRVTVMAEILIGGCERLAVWRSTHPGTTADEATELVVTTIWDGLASVGDA